MESMKNQKNHEFWEFAAAALIPVGLMAATAILTYTIMGPISKPSCSRRVENPTVIVDYSDPEKLYLRELHVIAKDSDGLNKEIGTTTDIRDIGSWPPVADYFEWSNGKKEIVLYVDFGKELPLYEPVGNGGALSKWSRIQKSYKPWSCSDKK